MNYEKNFFQLLKQHRGYCVLYENGEGILYEEIIRLAEENVQVLRDSGYKMGNVILVDVELGWRFIPIMLAAIKLNITLIPYDSFHNPSQFLELRKIFDKDPLFNSDCLTPQGNIKKNYSPFYSNNVLDDVCFLLYTSGTTGNPKGVMLTYENIFANVTGILNYFKLKKSDRLMIVRPLNNASALTGELLPSLITGNAIFIKPPTTPPTTIPRLVNTLKITALCTTPTVIHYLVSSFQKYTSLSLKKLVLSGEMVNEHHIKKIQSSFKEVTIWNAYGLTEAGPRVSCLTTSIDLQNVNCVGSPIMNVQTKVINNDGKELPEGEEGELLVSGPSIMKGYFMDDELTQEKIKNGWLYTADIARIVNGMIFVRGRKDSMFIRGGNNVFPTEIESVLLTHTSIKDALVFFNKEMNKTKVCAWIVLKKKISIDNIYEFLIKSGVDSRLWPDSIEIKNTINRTSSGKIKR
ncbi:class I adenylate-forming enzyme family protein [Cytobacillus praedii]|uniref:class I adenylate-forming enzyme family protein n=1 Tax=Cytobacillus praedii TaxID=1742358 RepID=UPI003F7E95DD